MVAGPRNQNVFLFGDFLIAGNYEHHCRNAVAFACLQKLLFPECRSQTSPVAGELLFRP